MPQILEMVNDFSQKADFLLVYTREAHPMDGWMLPNNYTQLPNHQMIEERIKAASLMREAGWGGPMAVDNMENECSRLFGAVPVRVFGVLNGTIRYAAKMGPMGYYPHEVVKWLESITALET